jgi:hypothetical protein
MPANAGIQVMDRLIPLENGIQARKRLDSRFDGNDGE